MAPKHPKPMPESRITESLLSCPLRVSQTEIDALATKWRAKAIPSEVLRHRQIELDDFILRGIFELNGVAVLDEPRNPLPDGYRGAAVMTFGTQFGLSWPDGFTEFMCHENAFVVIVGRSALNAGYGGSRVYTRIEGDTRPYSPGHEVRLRELLTLKDGGVTFPEVGTGEQIVGGSAIATPRPAPEPQRYSDIFSHRTRSEAHIQEVGSSDD